MKLTVRFSIMLALVFTLSQQSFSQISIQSSKGYSVNIYVAPVAINVHGLGNCTYGYNYDVRLEYVITFTGSNAPKSLYYMNGTLNSQSASLYFGMPNKPGTGTTKTSNAWTSANNCGTVTVASMNFKTISISLSADGIDNQTVTFAIVATLPVKLVNFSAREDQNKIKLNWQTATETDNDFFTVERSHNQNDWVALKTVKGAGNSTELRSYEATDDAPVSGTSYYRIRQTDFNGNATYSEVRSVRISGTTSKLSVFPVPNTGNTITINGIRDIRNHEISVVNAAGAVVYQAALSNATLDLPSLVKGIYFLRVKDRQSNETSTLRYVKL